MDYEATWYTHIDDRTVDLADARTERWRVSLIRESGDWKVCGFERRDADDPVSSSVD